MAGPTIDSEAGSLRPNLNLFVTEETRTEYSFSDIVGLLKDYGCRVPAIVAWRRMGEQLQHPDPAPARQVLKDLDDLGEGLMELRHGPDSLWLGWFPRDYCLDAATGAIKPTSPRIGTLSLILEGTWVDPLTLKNLQTPWLLEVGKDLMARLPGIYGQAGVGRLSEVVPGHTAPPNADILAGQILRLNWLNLWTKYAAENLGLDIIDSAEVWEAGELQDGGRYLVVSPSLFGCTIDMIGTVEERLLGEASGIPAWRAEAR